MKKNKKDIWEKIFIYPSFNIRFWFTLIIVLSFFMLGVTIFFKSNIVNSTADRISSINTFIQLATFILGIFAAYYALRQLVETRFTNLETAGMQELTKTRYMRAFEKWKEALYIRPDVSVFTNMCEALLLAEDYVAFDHYVKMSDKAGAIRNQLKDEDSYMIILLYLKAIRNLMVKNQGEAEKHIINLIKVTKRCGTVKLYWNFLDLETSMPYQDLKGECRNIAQNLILYLSKKMTANQQLYFESGNFSTQAEDQLLESTGALIEDSVN